MDDRTTSIRSPRRSPAEQQTLEKLCDFVQQGQHTEVLGLLVRGFHKGTQNGCFRMEHPMNMDENWGYPYFSGNLHLRIGNNDMMYESDEH